MTAPRKTNHELALEIAKGFYDYDRRTEEGLVAAIQLGLDAHAPADAALLARVLLAQPGEPLLDAARRLAEEVQEWRGACEAAFGIMTATPKKSLCDRAIAEWKHHCEHHQRERKAWESLKAIAILHGARGAEEQAAAALAALDEQGMP